jgi:hypothetical protein
VKRALYTLVAVVSFLAGAICSVSLQSLAQTRLEIGLGQTKFHARENGTWWQSGPSSSTNNQLISGSYLFGLGWSGDTFGFRVGYTRLGDYAGKNNVASVHDEDADHPLTAETCNPDTAKDCPAYYNGSGRAQGLYIGPTAERKFRSFVGVFELGLLFFRSTYDVTVYHPYDRAFGAAGNSFEHNMATGDHMTWYWGVSASYKLYRDASAVLLYRQYWNVYEQGRMPGGDVGLTGGRTRQLLVGISVAI